jgi:hypothetical protein
MVEQTFLCKSKNGINITYDPVHSHAATHLEDTPQLKSLVVEVVGSMELTGQEIARHTDMERVVGTCDVVAVDATDDIIYAIRKNRDSDGRVPFTKTREGQPSYDVAVHLVPRTNGSYELSSAWIGTFGDDEPFPESPEATEKSAEYWKHFAFVWGSQEIVPGTETMICPW